jgi:hypothetical protein
VVVAITFWLELPSSRAAITIDSILWLFLLAVVANVAFAQPTSWTCSYKRQPSDPSGSSSDGFYLHWELLLLPF